MENRPFLTLTYRSRKVCLCLNIKNLISMKNDKSKNKREKQVPRPKQEGNKYDKILHEIGDAAIFPIVTEALNIQVHKFSYRKTKMQTTLEREVDECYWIETEDGGEVILHLEYQAQNDPKMVLRVNLYVAMIRYFYPDKKIESVVVFIGDEEPTMRTELFPHEIFTGFEMIVAKKLNHKKLLASNEPNQVLLAILADYEKKDAEAVIRQIVTRLKKLCKTEKDLVKCCKQLLIFSIIRKLSKETQKILENMPVHINIAESAVFKSTFESELLEFRRRAEEAENRVEQEREEKEKVLKALDNSIISLLKYSSLSVSEIAASLNVKIELVLKIKEKLGN